MNIELETQEFLQFVTDWEEILEDECLCESKHLPGTSSPHCSILAKYRITVSCIKLSALICESLAVANMAFMEESENNFCIQCQKPADSCWTMSPL